MIDRLGELWRNLGWKIHGFAVGMSLVWGATLLGQSCAGGGG